MKWKKHDGRVTATLPKDEQEYLESLAQKLGMRSVGELVREALKIAKPVFEERLSEQVKSETA